MTVDPDARGVLAVFDEPVEPALRELAHEQGLALVVAQEPRQVLRMIQCIRPRVLVVQVGKSVPPALELIRLFVEGGSRATVIAVASVHSRELERAALVAGAGCYVPAKSVGLVSRVVQALLLAPRAQPSEPVHNAAKWRSQTQERTG